MIGSRGLLEPWSFFSSVRVHKLEQLLNSKLEYEYWVRNTYSVIKMRIYPRGIAGGLGESVKIWVLST